MQGQELGQWIIEFGLKIVEIFTHIWNVLSYPITIAKIDIFGWVITEGWTFTPLEASPYIGGVIVVIGLVSLFIPTH